VSEGLEPARQGPVPTHSGHSVLRVVREQARSGWETPAHTMDRSVRIENITLLETAALECHQRGAKEIQRPQDFDHAVPEVPEIIDQLLAAAASLSGPTPGRPRQLDRMSESGRDRAHGEVGTESVQTRCGALALEAHLASRLGPLRG